MWKILLILILAVFFACQGDSSQNPPENFQTAPAFTLTDVDGQVHSLEQYRGKVLVLNFFATWCGPCQDEMPQLEAHIWQAFKNQGLVVLGVDLKEDLGPVKLFAVNNNITFPLAIDQTGEVFRAYAGGDAVTNVPYNVIIDKNQKIRYSQTGYKENEMITLIQDLLQQ